MSTKRPSILFVFPDQLRKPALGFMNADPARTPRIDAFAGESLVLTDAISNYPVCSPYRGMMLTGQYPFTNGVLLNCNSLRPDIELKRDAVCVSDVLHDGGYSTGYIGKWHLEAPREPHLPPGEKNGRGGVAWDEYTPPERRHGFDLWHSYGAVDEHLHPRYWIGDAARDEYTTFDEWSPRHETDVAIRFIENRDGTQRDTDKPFALWMSMNPPHPPFCEVPPEYVEPFEELSGDRLFTRPNARVPEEEREAAETRARQYFGAVSGLDEQFGRLLDCLAEQGLEEDTIVVFTSDHGEMMRSHGLMMKNFHYEESLNVPFLIRWPGKIEPGSDDLLLGVPDIMPTLLGLAGLPIPEAVEGLDLSPALLGRPCERPESALYLRHYDGPAGDRGVRTHRHTYAVKRDDTGRETVFLHDNIEDPFQLRNVADEDPPAIARMEAELDRWLARTGDPWRRRARADK